MAKETSQETDSADGQADSPMTKADFDRIMQRLDAQSKYIARLEKGLAGKGSSAAEGRSSQAETNGDNPPGLKEQVEKIAQEQAQIRQEREALNHNKMADSIARALQKKGVQPLLAQDAAEVILSRNKSSFSLGNDGEAVFEHNGESLTTDAYSSMFLATEKGSAYLPVKNGPSRVMIPKGTSATGRQVTITSEQLATGNFDASNVENIAIAE